MQAISAEAVVRVESVEIFNGKQSFAISGLPLTVVHKGGYAALVRLWGGMASPTSRAAFLMATTSGFPQRRPIGPRWLLRLRHGRGGDRGRLSPSGEARPNQKLQQTAAATLVTRSSLSHSAAAAELGRSAARSGGLFA